MGHVPGEALRVVLCDPSDEVSSDSSDDASGDEPLDTPGDEPLDTPGDEPLDTPEDEPLDKVGDISGARSKTLPLPTPALPTPASPTSERWEAMTPTANTCLALFFSVRYNRILDIFKWSVEKQASPCLAARKDGGVVDETGVQKLATVAAQVVLDDVENCRNQSNGCLQCPVLATQCFLQVMSTHTFTTRHLQRLCVLLLAPRDALDLGSEQWHQSMFQIVTNLPCRALASCPISDATPTPRLKTQS